MRKATLVLSILLMVIVFVQSLLVGVGGTMFSDVLLSRGAFFGRIVAFLFGAGAAFTLGKPKISMLIFGVGGIVGVLGGLFTGYYDLIVWAALSLGLAVMSFFADREVDSAPAGSDEPIRTASQF